MPTTHTNKVFASNTVRVRRLGGTELVGVAVTVPECTEAS